MSLLRRSGVNIMHRILVLFCIFTFALGNKYGDYNLRKPDYGKRRQTVDLDSVTSEEMDGKAGVTAEDDRNDSNEPAVTAEDKNDSNEQSLTAEDKNDSNESSVTAEYSNDSNEPSVTAEDTNDSNEPSLTKEDTRNESNEPSVTAEDTNDNPYDRNLDYNYLQHDMDGELDEQRYKVELAAGDPTEFRSGNQHYHNPHFYANLGRRFVPVYPYSYKEVKEKIKYPQGEDLKPRWAPKAVVLAVMKKAIKNRPPLRPNDEEEFTRQSILRSGDYFDGVWKEEIKPGNILRTNKNNRHRHARNKEELFFRKFMFTPTNTANDVETKVLKEYQTKTYIKKNNFIKQNLNSIPITAKLVPGTKLYDLISGVVRQSPRLVYIINDE